ncbi:MAG: HAMP domain-containing histidine kinase, partial [Clostridium sp.]|nr:HAMP domain-containing histidine kinase [Clostridium sp.]
SERALMENQLRVLENRTYMELNHLVHDLKSPLTSMQTLVGVVKMSCENQQEEQNVHYLEMIESGIERMSNMISEILYEDRLNQTTTKRLIKGVLAQASAAEYAELIRADNHIPQTRIAVNVIRFTRALINLLENSFYAVDREKGSIWLEVSKATLDGRDAVCFEVRDNGSGIDEQLLERILENGFSTRNSSGLGLSFARTVVEQSGGRMDIRSTAGQGTQVKVYIPACEQEEETTAVLVNG